MPPYTVTFAPAAAREFRKLPADVRRRIGKKIDALATTPRPEGVKKLADSDSIYRIRIGEYRVLYQIRDAALHILVLRVGSRGDVYR